MFRMGTDSFSVLLRLCRLLNPSSSSRRSTRSSTSDWEMPKSSKVCGTVGLNPLWAGASVAAMKDSTPHSFHRPNRANCLHTLGRWRRQSSCEVVCLIVLLLIAGLAWRGAATQAEQLFHQAQKAEHDGEIVKAYRSVRGSRGGRPHQHRLLVARPGLAARRQPDGSQPAQAPDFPSDKIDRTLFGNITGAELEEARKPLPPTRLLAEPGRRDYDLQGDSKALWEQVAAALHLKVLFDADYQPTRAFRFELANADYRDALRALEAATNSFLVPISQRLIFVANDSTQKRTEFERTAAVAVPFPETISVQELQELATSIRGAMDSQKLTVDTTRHLILIRDRVAKVRLAEKLLADLLRPRAQVAIEVEILTTDLSSSLSYGLSLPTSFALSSFLNRRECDERLQLFASSFYDLSGVRRRRQPAGPGRHQRAAFRHALPSPARKASITRRWSRWTACLRRCMSARNIPIITSGYFGNTSSSGTVYTPPPTVSFEDLGLMIKVTPHVSSVDQVTLDLDAEFKLLGASSTNGIPVVANTQYQSKVDVMTGEWAVLSGLMTSQEAKTITGIPILSYIPLLRNNTISKDQGATLIVLKPHVTIAPPSASSGMEGMGGNRDAHAAGALDETPASKFSCQKCETRSASSPPCSNGHCRPSAGQSKNCAGFWSAIRRG